MDGDDCGESIALPPNKTSLACGIAVEQFIAEMDKEDQEGGEAELNPFASYWLEGDSLAPPCQAELQVVRAILEMANLSPSDHLADLGCGDGRICLAAAAQYGCMSTGVEIEDNLVKKFEAGIKRMGLTDIVRAVKGDLREVDLSFASVVVTYLLPDSIEEIKESVVVPLLQRGVRLICNTWGPKGLLPTRTVTLGNHNLFLLERDSLEGMS